MVACVLLRFMRDADGACSSGCQPVTVRNTGHVMADSEVQVRVSVMAAGWGNAVKVNKVSGSELRLPHLALKSRTSPGDSMWSSQITFLSVFPPALQTPSVRRTTRVCVARFMKGTDLPAQVIIQQEKWRRQPKQ